MIRFLGVSAFAASIVLAGSAHAAPLAARSPAVQLALPNSGPRVERTYQLGNAILDLPIVWASAATLGSAATIDVDGTSVQLPGGSILALQVLTEDGGPSVQAYCTARRAAERVTDRGLLAAPLWRLVLRPVLRSSTDRQLCLVDSDRDGRADQGLVIGDGSAEARTPHAIAPVPLEIADLVPISNQDRVRIVLTRVDRHGAWAEFEIEIKQQGHDRVFDTISGAWGGASRMNRITIGPTPPTEASIIGADFLILAVDGSARSVRIGWPDKADRTRYVAIPDALRIVYR